jgi:acylphosphatase
VGAARVVRRVRAVVRGRVQGVFFRASTEERAVALGVSGWVRNRDDGTVELEAEGEGARVAALLDWVSVGPPAARVARVEVEELTPSGQGGGFRARR